MKNSTNKMMMMMMMTKLHKWQQKQVNEREERLNHDDEIRT